MKRIEYFKLLSNIFSFKNVTDEHNNEYVLFSQSDDIPIRNIKDKTEFEALENHVHLLDNIKKEEFDELLPVADNLGKALLSRLKFQYPNKNFVVFVTINYDSFIIRFHQKWENEEPYYTPSEFTSSKEKVLSFEN